MGGVSKNFIATMRCRGRINTNDSWSIGQLNHISYSFLHIYWGIRWFQIFTIVIPLSPRVKNIDNKIHPVKQKLQFMLSNTCIGKNHDISKQVDDLFVLKDFSLCLNLKLSSGSPKPADAKARMKKILPKTCSWVRE